MFSREERCLYSKNPLGEVICQLRFPEILSISANAPADYQERIRAEYPQYLKKKELPPPRISGIPGAMKLENQDVTVNHQFATADGVWRINLTGRFISLSTSQYTSWEEFAGRLDKPLAAFIQIYQPAYFERIGLRYLNFISRRQLNLEDVPFSELIAPCYLGPLMEPDVLESSTTRCTVDAEMSIRGGCRAKLHAGPGLIRQTSGADSEIRFILDMDLYMPGNVPINLSAGAIQTLHGQADSIFRGAITEKLHEAMEPL